MIYYGDMKVTPNHFLIFIVFAGFLIGVSYASVKLTIKSGIMSFAFFTCLFISIFKLGMAGFPPWLFRMIAFGVLVIYLTDKEIEKRKLQQKQKGAPGDGRDPNQQPDDRAGGG